jgi:hypothetical protein
MRVHPISRFIHLDFWFDPDSLCHSSLALGAETKLSRMAAGTRGFIVPDSEDGSSRASCEAREKGDDNKEWT